MTGRKKVVVCSWNSSSSARLYVALHRTGFLLVHTAHLGQLGCNKSWSRRISPTIHARSEYKCMLREKCEPLMFTQPVSACGAAVLGRWVHRMSGEAQHWVLSSLMTYMCIRAPLSGSISHQMLGVIFLLPPVSLRRCLRLRREVGPLEAHAAASSHAALLALLLHVSASVAS